MSSIDNIVGNPKFINTRYFREAALDFKKNKGRYTTAPRFSKDWYEYWEEQERRCKKGYKVGGVKITGKHYFYMNFTQLKKVENAHQKKKVAHKAPDFPSFFEIDYDWWWYKEIAWSGCTEAQINKLKLWRKPSPNEDGTYGGGMHLSCLKARRGGFSYKEAADGVWNYNFIPGSKSYYFAAIEDYLTKDGILNKVQFDLEFLNQNTDGWWLKNRMEKDTLMHQMASYIDEHKNRKGYKSEIIGVIVNDPDKVRGKDGIKITYEEAGSFKNLKRALGISVPSVTEGATLTGQISVFGTGGEEKGSDIEGLEDVYSKPRLFSMLPFNNDWEEGYEGSECGVFVPCYMVNPSYMDIEGNVEKADAIKYEEGVRSLKKTSTDAKDLDSHIAEFPLVPTEALLRTGNLTFPKAEILLQKNRILRSKELLGRILHGEVVQSPDRGAIFQLKENAKPILQYPHKDSDDIRGCVTQIEAPKIITYIDKDGKTKRGVPPDTYLILLDPYYKDEPKGKQSTISLGAVYVVKLRDSIHIPSKADQDVAWFVGRPGRTEDLFDIVFKLSDMYNAKIQSEIAGGGQGLVDYARKKKKLDRLCFEPVYVNDKEIEKISKNRSYLMDMPTEKKRQGLQYYIDFLKTPVGLDENGNEIWNLHYIYDLGLLEECLKYNEDGNFDRISAQILKMFMLKEVFYTSLKKAKKAKASSSQIIGKRVLFGGQQQHNLSWINNEYYD